MKLSIFYLARTAALAGAIFTTCAVACDPSFDGCLGCNDDQLPVCLQAFVLDICKASGDPEHCDKTRAYDDAERYVLISTGSHMARVNALMRSARKYRLH